MMEREKALREALEAVDSLFLGKVPTDYGLGVSDAYGKIKGLLTQPPSDGWIPWSGGGCPVDPETVVDVRFSNGDEISGLSAGEWEWDLAGGGFSIIAYRVKEPEKRPYAGQTTLESGVTYVIDEPVAVEQQDPLDRPVTVREMVEVLRYEFELGDHPCRVMADLLERKAKGES